MSGCASVSFLAHEGGWPNWQFPNWQFGVVMQSSVGDSGTGFVLVAKFCLENMFFAIPETPTKNH
jgi:hypothetical protein